MSRQINHHHHPLQGSNGNNKNRNNNNNNRKPLSHGNMNGNVFVGKEDTESRPASPALNPGKKALRLNPLHDSLGHRKVSAASILQGQIDGLQKSINLLAMEQQKDEQASHPLSLRGDMHTRGDSTRTVIRRSQKGRPRLRTDENEGSGSCQELANPPHYFGPEEKKKINKGKENNDDLEVGPLELTHWKSFDDKDKAWAEGCMKKWAVSELTDEEEGDEEEDDSEEEEEEYYDDDGDEEDATSDVYASTYHPPAELLEELGAVCDDEGNNYTVMNCNFKSLPCNWEAIPDTEAECLTKVNVMAQKSGNADFYRSLRKVSTSTMYTCWGEPATAVKVFFSPVYVFLAGGLAKPKQLAKVAELEYTPRNTWLAVADEERSAGDRGGSALLPTHSGYIHEWEPAFVKDWELLDEAVASSSSSSSGNGNGNGNGNDNGSGSSRRASNYMPSLYPRAQTKAEGVLWKAESLRELLLVEKHMGGSEGTCSLYPVEMVTKKAGRVVQGVSFVDSKVPGFDRDLILTRDFLINHGIWWTASGDDGEPQHGWAGDKPHVPFTEAMAQKIDKNTHKWAEEGDEGECEVEAEEETWEHE